MTGNKSSSHGRTNTNGTDRTLVTIEPDHIAVRVNTRLATLCTELEGVSLDVVSRDSQRVRLEIRGSGEHIAASILLSSAGVDALAEGLSNAGDTPGEPHHG